MEHGFAVLAFWSPGPTEMIVIGVVALLLFGRRLPEMGRSLGRGLVEFRRGLTSPPEDSDAMDEPAASVASDESRTVS